MADFLSRFLADPAVSAIITAALAGLLMLWLLSALWVHGDAERRTGSVAAALVAAGWVLLSTPLVLPLSLAAYVLVRPVEPIAERRLREITTSMVADTLAAATCGTCGSVVEPDWRRCPTCTAWLAAPCAECGRWSDVELEVCPWCAERDRERPTVVEPATPAAVGVFGLASKPAAALVSSSTLRPATLRPALSARPTISGPQASDTATGRRAPGVAAAHRQRRTRPFQQRAPGGPARSLGRGTGGRTASGTRS